MPTAFPSGLLPHNTETADVTARKILELLNGTNADYPGATAPGNHAAVVTASATRLSATTRALYIGGAGSVTVTMAGGETGIVFSGLTAGSILPIAVTHVTAATATNVVALW